VFTHVNFVLATDPFNLTPTQLGLVYFVFVPAIFTTPMAGWLVVRMGAFPAFLLSMGIAIAGIVALLSDQLFVVLAGLAAVGAGTFCAQAVVSGFVGQTAKSNQAAASGLYLASYYCGGLVGAILLGQVYAAFGWTATIAVVTLAAVGSVILAAQLKPAAEKPAGLMASPQG
jgi:predicted MFS family arabinose efflux permease